MRMDITRRGMARLLVIGAAISLAACSSQTARAPVASAGRTAQMAREAPAPLPAQVPVAPSEAVWHVRAGLNVAALSCRGRGRAPVASAYGRVLTRHKALLTSAYSAEQRRYGRVAGMDKHQTKLYNRFANQSSPQAFCATAAQVAKEAGTMDSAQFAPAAPSLLARLQNPPRLARR